MVMRLYSNSLVKIFGADNLASGETRLAIVKQMADLAKTNSVTSAELEIVSAVFNEFYNDRFMAVRLEISKAVCEADFASRHLILKIAQDCASVSQFVLQYSEKLSNADLIEYIRFGTPVKQLAIACRATLGIDVVMALIEHGTFEVVYALVENKNAEISEHGFRQIYINFSNDARLRELLVSRDNIPADLRELIAFDVAKELETFVTNLNWLNKKQASNITTKSYEITVIEISDTIPELEIGAYIKQLSEEDRLTPSLILRSVTTGYMKFFEHAMAYLAGLPIKKLRSLLYYPNSSTRNALFSRTKLPVDLFPILTIAIEQYKLLMKKIGNINTYSKNAFSVLMIKNVTEYYHAQQDQNQAYLQRILDCYYIDINDKIAA